jgi:hypothetical protein
MKLVNVICLGLIEKSCGFESHQPYYKIFKVKLYLLITINHEIVYGFIYIEREYLNIL